MRQTRLNPILFALVATVATPLFALDLTPSFTAAQFKDKRIVLDKIDFPGGREDIDFLVRCDSVINTESVMASLQCYAPEPYRRSFVRETFNAAKDSAVAAATVDGEPVAVIMQFAVHYQRKDRQEQVDLYLHHDHNRGELGTGYTGVQRYALTNMETSIGCREHKRRFKAWGRVDVDPAGQATAFEIGKGDLVLGPCEEFIEQYMMKGPYIPALRDGQPVAARYYKIWKNFDAPDLVY